MEEKDDIDLNEHRKQLAKEESNLNKLVGDVFHIGSKFTKISVDDAELEKELQLLETSENIDGIDEARIDDDQELLELEALVKNEANDNNVKKQIDEEIKQPLKVSKESKVEGPKTPTITKVKPNEPPSGGIENAMTTAIKFRDEQKMEEARAWLVYAADEISKRSPGDSGISLNQAANYCKILKTCGRPHDVTQATLWASWVRQQAEIVKQKQSKKHKSTFSKKRGSTLKGSVRVIQQQSQQQLRRPLSQSQSQPRSQSQLQLQSQQSQQSGTPSHLQTHIPDQHIEIEVVAAVGLQHLLASSSITGSSSTHRLRVDYSVPATSTTERDSHQKKIQNSKNKINGKAGVEGVHIVWNELNATTLTGEEGTSRSTSAIFGQTVLHAFAPRSVYLNRLALALKTATTNGSSVSVSKNRSQAQMELAFRLVHISQPDKSKSNGGLFGMIFGHSSNVETETVLAQCSFPLTGLALRSEASCDLSLLEPNDVSDSKNRSRGRRSINAALGGSLRVIVRSREPLLKDKLPTTTRQEPADPSIAVNTTAMSIDTNNVERERMVAPTDNDSDSSIEVNKIEEKEKDSEVEDATPKEAPVVERSDDPSSITNTTPAQSSPLYATLRVVPFDSLSSAQLKNPLDLSLVVCMNYIDMMMNRIEDALQKESTNSANMEVVDALNGDKRVLVSIQQIAADAVQDGSMTPQMYLKRLLAAFNRDKQLLAYVRQERLVTIPTTPDQAIWYLSFEGTMTVEDALKERMQVTQQEYQDIATSLAEIELNRVI